MLQRLPYYYRAQKESIERARKLRRESTFAEKFLWQVLRRKALQGYKFRRQHPIGQYIADFYCHNALLVIEVDGDIHDDEDIKKKDAIRDRVMRRFGLKILRFSNEEVLFNAHIVVAQIEKHLRPSP